MAALAALALTMSGCGGGDQSSNGTGAPASDAMASTTSNQINPKSRDQLQDGGTLTWPIDAIPPSFNYFYVDGPNYDGHNIISAVLPEWYRSDATGTLHWNRDLLASEPTLVSEPKQVVTARINPKAIWYDGTPITWEDFHWQWRAANGSNDAYQISSSNGFSDIESVERGQDDREVVITFRQPYADWRAIYAPLYPASDMKDPKVFNEGWRTLRTSAGPFKLDRIDETAKTVTLVRNEKWWGDRAKLERIVFRALDRPAMVDALANGEVDTVDIGPDANNYSRARAIDGVEIRTAGGPNFRHLTINGTSPNLQDVRVRRALAMAIDRGAIARALIGPLGVDARPLNNHIFMANQKGYQDNSGDVGKFDPEASRRLLDEAGWKLEGSARTKDGKPLELRIVIPSGVPTSRQESELIQNMAAQVGITVKINVVPSPDFFDKNIRPGQFDLTVFSWVGTPFPISQSQSLYKKPTRDSKGQLDVQQNYARIGSDEIDTLLAQATRELDPDKAIALANQADALIWAEVHSLTLYQRPELFATKRLLANFGAFGFAQPRTYQDIGWMKP
jgi:peptide/nickel transport system substrate-binding protein